ncbi:aminoacyl--tRNA ligase-related protein [Streptomyces sp. NPDC003077]|uniref:aminoacyl--tRNA ligase-related protein n=1 Tax=Streptomyces sp. NPDC003077 TaxID=3154443 RepID=UPI0033A11378
MTVADRPPRPAPPWSVRDGLATLDEPATELLRTLDDTFAAWGTAAGAVRMTFPPLLRAADLRTLDYFRNFPHLGSLVARLRPDRLTAYGDGASPASGGSTDVTPAPANGTTGTVPAHDLTAAAHLLPSAACYACFLHFSGMRTDAPLLVTTAAQCFRNEDRHDGLRRMWGFTMREIVCVGPADRVRDHLDRSHARIAAFAARLGLPLSRQPATDPFFQKDGARSVMQVLAPVKDEYVHTDGTAVASVNHHRNFFGERCDIRYAGRPAFTGCVAFGLERWLHVLAERFAGDLDAARAAVREAGAAVRDAGERP